MSRPPQAPPLIAGAILDLLEPSGAVRGDLDEEFRRHVSRQRSATAAALWYWGQTVRSLPALLVRRRGGTAQGWFARRGTELRFAAKALRRRPGYTALAVATFAIAMGTNTAVFSVVHGVLLRPLPFAHESRLVRINPDQLFYTGLSNARRFSSHADAFAAVAPWGRTLFTFVGDGEGEEVRGAAVEWTHFDMLGARPLLGRTFRAEDASSPSDALILSYAFWQRRFGGDPSVIGRRVTVADGTHTVIGVMALDHVPMEPDWLAWSPLPADAASSQIPLAMNARLKPGLSVADGEASARRAYAAMALEDGTTWSEADRLGVSVVSLRRHLLGDVEQPLFLLLGAVVFILLLACVNVMNLLLAQGALREHEFALRLALGASTGRLTGQILAEVSLVAAAGAINGLWLAWLALGWASARIPATVPRVSALTIDVPVFVYAGAAMFAATLLAGVVPAIAVTRRAVSGALSNGSSRVSHDHRRLSAGLIASEVALSIVLVIGAGLMIRSVGALGAVDPGFDPDRAVAVRVAPPEGRYADAAALDAFYARIRDEARRSPLITEAGSVLFLPMTPGGAWSGYAVEGGEPASGQDAPRAGFRPITPGYLKAMGIRLIRGRRIMPEDTATSDPVGVINERLARDAFGLSDPVGRFLRLGSGAEQSRLRVVGVVADVRQSDTRTPSHPEVYLPESQTGMSRLYVVARTNGDTGQALRDLQHAVHTVDQDALVSRAMLVRDVVARSHADTRFVAEMLGLFGLVALLLGAVGVYGVTAHAVSQRKRDIGIRMALGADRGQVALRTFLGGMAPVIVGIAAGVAVALLGSRTIAGLLFGVTATDPVTMVVAPALLAAMGATALALPALRASRIDPVRSLRDE